MKGDVDVFNFSVTCCNVVVNTTVLVKFLVTAIRTGEAKRGPRSCLSVKLIKMVTKVTNTEVCCIVFS